MAHPRSDLIEHLRAAAWTYGASLPIAVPRREPPAPVGSGESVASIEPVGSVDRSATPAPPAEARQEATPPVPESAADRATALTELQQEALACDRCKLRAGCNQVVFGEGNPDARLLFIGEAPGAREDAEGRPFVGPAGQLLTKIIVRGMGLRRSDVYIANVNKCRPPGNRNPEPDEVAACLPFLRRQVELIQPEAIVALGRVAAHNLLGSTQSVSALRRGTQSYAETPVVVSWHPAYLLRNPAAKKETWEDVQKVNRMLGLPGPSSS